MRLIDVDEITDADITNALGMEYCSCLPDIRDMLNDQPTAYELDEVMKRLEKELKLANDEKERCSRENQLQFDSAKGYTQGIAVAIEIGKDGRNI